MKQFSSLLRSFSFLRLFFFWGGVLLFPLSFSYAAVPVGCTNDFFADGFAMGTFGEITDNSNWSHNMYLKGEDGYLWKRGLLSMDNDSLTLEEQGSFRIDGRAEIESDVQVFVYVQDRNGKDDLYWIKHPATIEGICFKTVANTTGAFSFTLPGRHFWRGLGKGNTVVDAFYKTKQPWADFMYRRGLGTNKNVLVGSHVAPKILKFKTPPPGPELDNCIRAPNCELDVLQAVKLAPGNFPRKPLLGSNFLKTDYQPFNIYRFPGDHTFYGQGGNKVTPEHLREFTHKALAMEILKRYLLGDESVGGETPGLKSFEAGDVDAAYVGEGGVSIKTMEALENIRSIIIDESPVTVLPDAVGIPTSPGGNPGDIPPTIPRDDVIDFLENTVNMYPANPGEKINNLVAQVFPPNSTATVDSWIDDFVRIMQFWTGQRTRNLCLMDEADTGIQLVDNFIDDRMKDEPEIICDNYTYVSGITPSLRLFSQDSLRLSPDFSGVSIDFSSMPFDVEESWFLPRGNKHPLSYKYKPFQEIHTEFEEQFSCIQKQEIGSFADALVEKYDFGEAEREMVVSELQNAFPESPDFFRIDIANPDDVAQYFRWNVNESPVSLLQIFVALEESGCQSHAIGSFPEAPAQIDGFEIGILPQ